MIKYFTLTITLLFSILINAQEIITEIEEDEWYTVYESKDRSLKLQVKFEISQNLCGQNSPTKFLYKYKGQLEDVENYGKWELDYLDCNDVTYTMTGYAPLSSKCENMSGIGKNQDFHMQEEEESLTAKKLVEIRPNVGNANEYFSLPKKEAILKNSFDPERLVANKTTVKYMENVTLTIEGGSLGIGAEWKLYESTCGGTPIPSKSNEKVFNIIAEKTTVYFARAEGQNNQTTCVSIKVEVDKSSTLPKSIKGKNQICTGSSTTLDLDGGVLGPGSQWHWYQDECELGSSIGTGVSIEVSPTSTTNYFVRAQSNDGTNISSCISKRIEVVNKPTDPRDISTTYNLDEICEGKKIVLKAEGELQNGCYWRWSTTNDYNTILSKNEELVVTPDNTTVYILQMDNDQCGASIQVKQEIIVYRKSVKPNIEQIYDSKGKKSNLVVTGGYLAEKSKWIWYSYDEKKGHIKLETGDKLAVIKKYQENKIFVRAEGSKCEDQTQYAEIMVRNSDKKEKLTQPINLKYSKTNKNLHFGFHFGVDYSLYQDSIYSDNVSFQNKQIERIYPGYIVGLEFHPVFKEKFYFGMFGTYGSSSSFLTESIKNDTTERISSGNINYTFGGELGWSISRSNVVKMFVKYNRKIIGLNISSDLSARDSLTGNFPSPFANYSNNNESYLDMLSLGFRFGTFGADNRVKNNGNVKQAHHLDLKLNLHNRSYKNNFESFQKIGDWRLGFDVSYWRHSLWRFGLNIGYNQNISQLISGNSTVLPDYYVGYFAINLDFFK